MPTRLWVSLGVLITVVGISALLALPRIVAEQWEAQPERRVAGQVQAQVQAFLATLAPEVRAALDRDGPASPHWSSYVQALEAYAATPDHALLRAYLAWRQVAVRGDLPGREAGRSSVRRNAALAFLALRPLGLEDAAAIEQFARSWAAGPAP